MGIVMNSDVTSKLTNHVFIVDMLSRITTKKLGIFKSVPKKLGVFKSVPVMLYLLSYILGQFQWRRPEHVNC